MDRIMVGLTQRGYTDIELMTIKEDMDKLHLKCTSILPHHSTTTTETLSSMPQPSSNQTTTASPKGANVKVTDHDDDDDDDDHALRSLVQCVSIFDKLMQSFIDTVLTSDGQYLSERYSKLAVNDLAMRSMPYSLFVRGMVHRFAAMSLGVIYVR